MDKKEYKIRLEEIKTLIANNQFEDAANIADRIDWRQIKNFGTLEKISNLYKSLRKYDYAFTIAEYAYDINPVNSNIVFSLCELSIEQNNLIMAMDFLKRYRDLVPNNPACYILEYKIKELGNATLEEKIDILEEYKHKDPRQEWIYQLAYLYHRVGLKTKCIETCDELITMIGDGPFVIKAMELKMLHTPLTNRQKAIYDARYSIQDELEAVESEEYTAERPEPGVMPELGEEEDFHVKTIDMGKFNTMNLQKALADSMRELLGEEEKKSDTGRIVKSHKDSMGNTKDFSTDPFMSTDRILGGGYEVEELADEPEEEYIDEEYSEEYADEEYVDEEYSEEYADEEYAGEEYSEEYANEEYADEEYSEEYADEEYADEEYSEEYADEEYADEGYSEEYTEDEYSEDYAENPEDGEIFFEDKTGDIIIDKTPFGMMEDLIPNRATDNMNATGKLSKTGKMSDEEAMALAAAAIGKATGSTGRIRVADIPTGSMKAASKTIRDMEKTGSLKATDNSQVKSAKERPKRTMEEYNNIQSKPVIRTVPRSEVEKLESTTANMSQAVNITRKLKDSNYSFGRKGPFDDVLSQETDGQISLAIPKDTVPGFEKQITGQMNIQEVLAEWEEKKKEREKRQQESINNDILQSTGKIFENYDNELKNGILAQLEEEEKQNKRLIKNDIELHKVDDFKDNVVDAVDITTEEESPFDATSELNKQYNMSLWEEVDKAIAADKEKQAESENLDLEDIDSESSDENAEELLEENSEENTDNSEETAEEAADITEESNSDELDSKESDSEESGKEESVSENADEESYEAEYDEDGNLIEYDQYGYPIEYDENGNVIEYDEYGYPIEYDEDGNVIEYTGYYDEDGEYHEYSDEYDEYSESENAKDLEESEANEDAEADKEEATEEFEEANYDDSDNQEILNTAQINDIGSALEANADKVTKDIVEENNDDYDPETERDFSADEQELFADFMYSKKMRNQILNAVDLISLASYVGNVIITGDEEVVSIDLAKALIKEVQLIDANFISQKVAKISGGKMNRKDISQLFSQLANGALIVEKAGEMKKETLENIAKALENMQDGILVVLTDRKRAMDKMVSKYKMIEGYFNVRVDITPMNNNALVDYAKKYAYSQEYKIDEERAVLALYQRIEELQIGDHNVTKAEIEEIVDNAIEKASKLRFSTFVNIITGKRFDYEDMIILSEKDFS